MQTKPKSFNRISILVALLLLISTLFVSPALAIDPPPGGSTEGAQEAQDARSADPQSSYALGSTQSGTLLADRFGVTLALKSNSGGANGYSFDWNSFKPTKNANTVDWIESDWYGMWNTSNTGGTSTVRGIFPSGGEWYDVEALYFDNDDQNFYIAIVTSSPHYKDWGNGHVGVGIYDRRIDNGFWIRPGDLSINLGLNTARDERYSSTWSYDYGLDLVHENRGQLGSGTTAMRDNNLGTALYRTQNDAGGSDNENPGSSDWYTSGPAHNTIAYWEHTNFDPIYSNRTSLGNTTVSYYRYDFAGGALENNAETYVIEATVPRSFFGGNNPGNGDEIAIRWVEGCRNDGNSEDAVIHLDGDVDYPEVGDAPDSTNHDGATMTYSGDPLDPDPITANFPTVSDPGTTSGGDPAGMCHLVLPDSARLGSNISAERDADQSPDQDSPAFPTNIIPLADLADLDTDDGLILPGSWQDGVLANIQYEVTVPAGGNSGKRYVNVWFDWNRDGDWADPGVACRTSGNFADEHVIKNDEVTVAPGNSQTFTKQILPCNPNADNEKIWVRITLSDEPVETNNVRDEFNNFSFGNNDGTANWGNSWQEVDESLGSGPADGEVKVFNGRLCIGPNNIDNSPYPGPGAWRELNLSGATSATFSFDYEATNNNSNDHVVVQVREADGSWATLETISGTSSGSRSYDISSYINADTDIRFRTSQYYGGASDVVCFDNVQVAYSTGVEDGRGAGYCYADGETEDWYFTPQTPTGVEIAAFDALADGNTVLVTWETASELSILGFDLERAESADGPWTQLNEGMILGKVPGNPIGATYEFLDTSVVGGNTYHYRLVMRGTSGEPSYFGPIDVLVPQIGEPLPPAPAGVYRVYLPFVGK